MNIKGETPDREGAGEKLNLPPVIFGTSGLGNLFVALDEESKCEIIKECLRLSKGTVVFDSAGKYGAGLALEVLGRCLKKLDVSPNQVVISNKLAWVRTELKTPEPTFELGVWKDLEYDAVQKISYDGIMECFEQGNKLLDGYIPQMVSVHDPDEYIASAINKKQIEQRYNDILDAYEALFDLKREGKIKAIGVGAKDWKIIRRIVQDVPLDWVMIANSMTIKSHPVELLNFMSQIERNGVTIINAAVFHSGFLVGGDYFDYKLVNSGTSRNEDLFRWRDAFFDVCKLYGVKPAAACIQFSLNAPGVKSIALNTSDMKRIKENMAFTDTEIPAAFWEALRQNEIININITNERSISINQQ
jgi:D-threo-aldose 1-dehydrogenase